jgi:2-polyprenyl-3-methyl-5-hydroxy-6-metoxy-1,4-benzoquinol methylase
VTAWDLSPVAIQRLSEQAQRRGFGGLWAEVRDVLASPPTPSSFDVIVCSHFLERALMPALSAAIRPGGILFYQTFSETRITGVGPSNPAFRLADNELLRLLPDLRLRFYREEASLGHLDAGYRDLAMLVAERPR